MYSVIRLQLSGQRNDIMNVIEGVSGASTQVAWGKDQETVAELSIPETGPCAGHACDSCSICRRGRCCRRDQPDYQLPALGSWPEPIYGQLGVLATDDEQAQCHICGAWYRYLANHVWRTHHLWADEYKALFGLNATTGLVGPATRSLQQQIARQVFHDYWNQNAANLTSEQRSAYNRGRKWRLEGLSNQETRRKWAERSRTRYLAGAWSPPRVIPKEVSEKGTARFKELLQDPVYRDRYGQAVRERMGARLTVPCAICGTPIQVQRYLLRRSKRKVCSKACFRELRRREMTEHPHQRENMERIAAQLRNLDAASFGKLSEQQQEIVRFYYGVDTGEPSTLAATMNHFGLTYYRVRQILLQAVRLMLG